MPSPYVQSTQAEGNRATKEAARVKRATYQKIAEVRFKKRCDESSFTVNGSQQEVSRRDANLLAKAITILLKHEGRLNDLVEDIRYDKKGTQYG